MRQSLRQLGTSLLFAAISFFVIIGGLVTALAEKRTNQPPTVTLTETSLPTSVPQTEAAADTPAAQNLLPSPSISPSPTATATLLPSTTCPIPNGWTSYIVQLGDTLDALALRYGITAAILQEKNCLVTSALLPDTRLYVPSYPTATPIPCGAPYNWTIFYNVQAGDNLYRIGLKYRVTVAQLQQANCLGYSTQISVGQRLYVPNVPTSTPEVTNTPIPTSTLPATLTATNAPSTATLTLTSVPPTASLTFTSAPPTDAFTATATETPAFTNTPEATE